MCTGAFTWRLARSALLLISKLPTGRLTGDLALAASGSQKPYRSKLATLLGRWRETLMVAATGMWRAKQTSLATPLNCVGDEEKGETEGDGCGALVG